MGEETTPSAYAYTVANKCELSLTCLSYSYTPYLLPLEMLWLESGSAGPRLLARQVTGACVSLNISEKDSEREVAADRISKSAIPSATLCMSGPRFELQGAGTHNT